MSHPVPRSAPPYAPHAQSTRFRPALGLLLVLLAGFASLFAINATHSHADNAPATTNLKVGALLDLSDGWETLGKTSQAALNLAATAINAQSGMPHVTVTVADTHLDPATALTDLQQFYADGIRVVVGPQSSSEVAAIRDYADSHGIIIISQGSTASSLSLPGDNIFRLPPDDKLETVAMAALMEADGLTTVIPVWRDDAGNQGLVDSLRTALTAGGVTVTDGVKYATTTTDFSSTMTQVAAQLTAAQATPNAKVGIYLASFGETPQLFDAAAAVNALGAVEWYGADGIALSPDLTGDATAAAFAEKVTFPAPIFGLDRTEAGQALWQPISDQIKAATGITPDAFGLSAYDALMLLANTAKTVDPTADSAAFATALVAQAATESGITGPLTLNANGDRAAGPFDFWQVCQVSGAPQWVLGATYLPAASGPGTITRTSGCTPPPTCVGQTISLSGQWSLIAWPGPDGETVADALAGSAGCRNDITADVSVVWSYDSSTSTWTGYFPADATVPGANDLQTLTAGSGYFIGLNPGVATPVDW
ncbi:MAG TPA: ABC transporter substrate-binding protein [Tepidiformaceae bacterium]|nr:ABC transporter substrate-binding protein [Tepidiformaceae bacterium]